MTLSKPGWIDYARAHSSQRLARKTNSLILVSHNALQSLVERPVSDLSI